MDALTDLLSRTQARGAVFAHVVASGRWGIHIDDDAPLGFHAVLAGEAWLKPPVGEPRQLAQGDLALLPEPGTFALLSEPIVTSVPLEDARRRWQKDGHRIEIPGEGAEASLVCGGYHFEGDLFRPLERGTFSLRRGVFPLSSLGQKWDKTAPRSVGHDWLTAVYLQLCRGSVPASPFGFGSYATLESLLGLPLG